MLKAIGNSDLTSLPIGIGCMAMSEFYGPLDNVNSFKTLTYAIQRGIRLFDTADMYGRGHNERLLSMLLHEHRQQMIIATKCGVVRTNNPSDRSFNGKPDYIKQCCDDSLMRLGVDVIDLYYLHRIDPAIPLEESIGAMADLVQAGKVRYLGISEATLQQIQLAHQVHPLTAVQNEMSLWSRESDAGIRQFCLKNQIGLIAYSPLGRGFLTGKLHRQSLQHGDFRLNNPRFQPAAINGNQPFLDLLHSLAEQLHCTLAQVALAWVIQRGAFAIPGMRSAQRIDENLAALDIELTVDMLTAIDNLLPDGTTVGSRY